jgi:gluconolactonase
MAATVLLRGTVKQIGEGPHWEESSKSLLYVDMWTGDVHKWDSVTGEDSKLHIGDDISFIIPRTRGGYVMSCDQKIGFLDWTNGKFEEVARVDCGKPNFRINDGKCDPAGRLWTGTMRPISEAPSSVRDHVLCSLDADYKLKTHKKNVGLSNGLAWTGDARTMFYADTTTRVIYAYDFNNETGEIANERPAINFDSVAELNADVKPDGMSIDAEDKLWVACYRAGKVIRFDPETAKILHTIEFPDSPHTTS